MLLQFLLLFAGAGEHEGISFLIEPDPWGYHLGLSNFGYSPGVLAVHYNPACLASGLSDFQYQIEVSGVHFLSDLKGMEVSVDFPIHGGFALGGRFFGYTVEVPCYDSSGEQLSSVKVGGYVLELSGSFGLPFARGLDGGARLKMNLDDLGEDEIFNGAVDLGVHYSISGKFPGKADLGFVVGNIGYSSYGTFTCAGAMGGIVYTREFKDLSLKVGGGFAYEVEPKAGVGFSVMRNFQIGGPKNDRFKISLTLGGSYEYFPSAAYIGFGSGVKGSFTMSFRTARGTYSFAFGARPMADFASFYSVGLMYTSGF